jgi:hypothetical protein
MPRNRSDQLKGRIERLSWTKAPQPVNQLVKPVQFPAQSQEWKIVSLRECPTPDTINNVKHLIRQPPIRTRISPLILTSILNANVWL